MQKISATSARLSPIAGISGPIFSHNEGASSFSANFA